jgi:hypothetical protein
MPWPQPGCSFAQTRRDWRLVLRFPISNGADRFGTRLAAALPEALLRSAINRQQELAPRGCRQNKAPTFQIMADFWKSAPGRRARLTTKVMDCTRSVLVMILRPLQEVAPCSRRRYLCISLHLSSPKVCVRRAQACDPGRPRLCVSRQPRKLLRPRAADREARKRAW